MYLDYSKLKLELATAEMTIKELADSAGLSRSTISSVGKSYQKVNEKTVGRICKALNVPAARFIIDRVELISRCANIRTMQQQAENNGFEFEAAALAKELEKIQMIIEKTE